MDTSDVSAMGLTEMSRPDSVLVIFQDDWPLFEVSQKVMLCTKMVGWKLGLHSYSTGRCSYQKRTTSEHFY